MIESIRGSIWKSKVNSGLGVLFLGVVALWAGSVIVQAAWGVSPVTKAFASVTNREIVLPD